MNEIYPKYIWYYLIKLLNCHRNLIILRDILCVCFIHFAKKYFLRILLYDWYDFTLGIDKYWDRWHTTHVCFDDYLFTKWFQQCRFSLFECSQLVPHQFFVKGVLEKSCNEEYCKIMIFLRVGIKRHFWILLNVGKLWNYFFKNYWIPIIFKDA